MKKLNAIRNSMYLILLLLISTALFSSALCFSHNDAYFSTPTNFNVTKNESGKSTKEINQKIINFANHHDLEVVKKVYLNKNNDVIVKNYQLGKHNYAKDLPKNSFTHSNEALETGLETTYGIFGPGNHETLNKFLAENGIRGFSFNPASFEGASKDIASQLQMSHFEYLILSLILVIVAYNFYVIFRQRKMFMLKKLFYGDSSLKNILSSWWLNTKGFFYAYVLTWCGLGLAAYIFIREMWEYLLTCYLLVGVVLGILIVIINLLMVIILNNGSIISTIKGKGSKVSVILLTWVTLTASFLLFVTVLNLNLTNQKDLGLFQSSEKSWDKVRDFNTLDFHTMDNNGKKSLQKSETLLKYVAPKDLLFNKLVDMGGPAESGASQENPSDFEDTNFYVNPTYFEYQNVKNENGKRIKMKDFLTALTLLTTTDINQNEIEKRFAKPNAVKVSQIKIKKMLPAHFFFYSSNNFNLETAYQQPKQVLVINWKQAEKLPKSAFDAAVLNPKDQQSRYLVSDNPLLQNLIAYVSSRDVLVRFSSANNRHALVKSMSPELQEVSNTAKIRADLQTRLRIQQVSLIVSEITALIVIIVCGYVLTYLILMTYRKKLFLQKIYGFSFFRRYAPVYLLFGGALLPGIFVSGSNFKLLMEVIILILVLVLILTAEIIFNERKTYQTLKGEI
ncbi:hypothetical protein [Fructilactobacillus frigidiflavus]|uniref:hypothetical protein n=1 Tax=Fructilactobacillus frigidiflavus TaxID=3242688 RepID=UPI003756C2BA